MTEKDVLYVYSTSVPPFLFRNSYGRSQLGKHIDPSVENVILGENAYNETLNTNDIETILRLDRRYILVSYSMIWDKDLENMLATLNDRCWVQKVAEYSETPLYLFRQNPEKNIIN